MELFYYNVNGVTQLYDGLDVYFTPFKQATEASLQNAVDYFNGGSGTEEERLFAAESAVLMYEAASGKTKSAITDYAAFAAAYYAKLDSTYGVGRENKIVGFDTEGGAKQVYISIAGKLGSDVSYTEKPVFSKDRAYGNENGSTRFKQGQFTTDTANVWYTIRVALSKDVAMYNKIRFAVYNESSISVWEIAALRSKAIVGRKWNLTFPTLRQAKNSSLKWIAATNSAGMPCGFPQSTE